MSLALVEVNPEGVLEGFKSLGVGRGVEPPAHSAAPIANMIREANDDRK